MTAEAVERLDTIDALVIRVANPRDLEAVIALLRQSALPDTGVREAFASFLVATRNDRIVGSCGLESYGADGLLRSVVVAPDERKRGIAQQLTRLALLRAGERGLNHVYLLTTTAPAYFAALGFEIAARDAAPEGIRGSWEFSNGCPSTATFMRRAP
jgi:amino-acid N-acetyltransferase